MRDRVLGSVHAASVTVTLWTGVAATVGDGVEDVVVVVAEVGALDVGAAEVEAPARALAEEDGVLPGAAAPLPLPENAPPRSASTSTITRTTRPAAVRRTRMPRLVMRSRTTVCGCGFDEAGGRGDVTGLALQLQRRVSDGELRRQTILESLAHHPGLLERWVTTHEDVGTHRAEVRGQAPDMKIVDAEHAGVGAECRDHPVDVKAGRRRLEEDVGRVPYETQCLGADEDRDEEGGERVEQVGAAEPDGETRSRDPH